MKTRLGIIALSLALGSTIPATVPGWSAPLAPGDFAALAGTGAPDTQPPTIPTHFGAYPSLKSVFLYWWPSYDNVGVAGYTIYRDGVFLSTVIPSYMRTLAYTDTSVTEATTYTYDADAFDAAGNHSYTSTPVTVTIPMSVHVESITASAFFVGSTETLNFRVLVTDRNLFPVSGCYVGAYLKKPDQSQSYTSLPTDTSGTVVFPYYVSGQPLPAGPYVLTVMSVSAAAGYYYDAAQNKTTTAGYTAAGDTAPPSVPTGLTGSASGNTSVFLSWNPSSDNVALAGYELFRDGVLVAAIATAPVGTRRVYYSDNGPFPEGVPLTYQVDAYDTSDNRSALSAPLTVPIPSSVHVGSIALSFRTDKPTRTDYLDSRVTVLGSDGLPRAGIMVGGYVALPDKSFFTMSALTDSAGTAVLTYPNSATGRKLPVGTYTFTVTGLSGTGFFYDPAQNAASSASIVKSRK